MLSLTLSRPVLLIEANNEGFWLGKSREEMRNLQREEERWKVLIDYIEGGKVPNKIYKRATLDQFTLWEGILHYSVTKKDGSVNFCLVVPQSLKKSALHHAHTKSGHLGQRKTLAMAEDLFYWPNIKVDVCSYVKTCVVCQQVKQSVGLQQQWQELPPVDKPLQQVSIDLTDMVSGAQGYWYVLTVLDHYSRYTKLYPLKSKTSEEVREAFAGYLADYGARHTLLVDNGGEFISQSFKEFCRRRGITLAYTTPYHPQGNSVTERMHQTLKSILAALCQGHPQRWPKFLQMCQAVMNEAIHSTTGQSPCFAFYGRHPGRAIGTRLPGIDGTEDGVAEAHAILKEMRLKMARRHRNVANRRRRNQAVAQGSLVWVRNESTIPETSCKLNVKWLGPFRVIEVIRDGGAYLLENVFMHQQCQRAADKVKPYCSEEEWILEPQEVIVPEAEDSEPKPLPPRTQRPPRRYIEESLVRE